MRLLMANVKSTGPEYSRFATTLLILIFAASAVAQQPGAHRPLPQQVLSEAPGMHPFGKGRHTLWGVRVYDATLWIAGLQWSANAPQKGTVSTEVSGRQAG